MTSGKTCGRKKRSVIWSAPSKRSSSIEKSPELLYTINSFKYGPSVRCQRSTQVPLTFLRGRYGFDRGGLGLSCASEGSSPSETAVNNNWQTKQQLSIRS